MLNHARGWNFYRGREAGEELGAGNAEGNAGTKQSWSSRRNSSSSIP